MTTKSVMKAPYMSQEKELARYRKRDPKDKSRADFDFRIQKICGNKQIVDVIIAQIADKSLIILLSSARINWIRCYGLVATSQQQKHPE